MADVIVKGGLVVDGTGTRPLEADVAIADGRIVEIGTGLRGGRILDATGLVVAPGFFDIHTHYDGQVLWDPALTPSAWHGVTSVVAGNCGFSFAPCRPGDRELVMRTLERVEDMPYASLAAGIDWDFQTYGDYLGAVTRRGTLINFGGYVGHTTVRIFVMTPTTDRLARPSCKKWNRWLPTPCGRAPWGSRRARSPCTAGGRAGRCRQTWRPPAS
jgi:N-acyl-D-aspartate/D-glutamate deacylase